MKRKIIEIDEKLCNGCGSCIPNCPEGAIRMIDGKARLVSDLFCDGLGACLGECPQGAITMTEREAAPYDERLVMERIAAQGANTVRAHLHHLRSHGEQELHRIAVEYLREKGIPVPEEAAEETLGRGCPGTLAKALTPRKPAAAVPPEETPSALRQWPVQLRLLNPEAPYFDGADLLVSADCVPCAMGGFHRELLDGKILVIFCPKLDEDTEEYVSKLAEIFRRHDIRSVTVARMTVPCCGGTVAIVEKALESAGRRIPLDVRIIDLNGEPVREARRTPGQP